MLVIVIAFILSPPPYREGDLPGALCAEGAAAGLSGQLLPLHGLPDHAALQQGGGVDPLLQARISLPLTGAFGTHTGTHTHTHRHTTTH